MTLNLLELSLGWDEEKLKRQLSLPYFMFCHAEKKKLIFLIMEEEGKVGHN